MSKHDALETEVIDGINKMTLAMAFETAMIDAINVYDREVLLARGHLSREGFDASGSEECLEAKYKIARECAAKWAAFDGYDRSPTE